MSFVVCFWALWHAVALARDGGTLVHTLYRTAAIIAIVFLLGVGLASVQLLMTADLAAQAPHGEVGNLDYVTSYSLLPVHLLGLILPDWQGTPADGSYRGMPFYWEYVVYIGLLPLLLAAIGGSSKRGSPLVILMAIGFGLALAKGNPVYALLRHLPGFGHFRAPARYMLFFTFAAAILTAQGWQVVTSLLAAKHRLLMALCTATVIGLVTADLWHLDRLLSPLSTDRLLRQEPAVVTQLHRDRGWYRVLVFSDVGVDSSWLPRSGWLGDPDGWVEARRRLAGDVAQSYGLRSLSGYVGFTDSRYGAFLARAVRRVLERQDGSLLALLGTRYVVLAAPASRDVGGGEASRQAVAGPFQSFPRAFLVGRTIAVTDGGAMAATESLATSRLLNTTAAVEADPAGELDAALPDGTLEVWEPRPERIVFRVSCHAPALLVLNERWDSGWRVSVDGGEALLLRVDTVLMGTRVIPGEHLVEFTYRPRGLVVGRAVTAVSCLVLVSLLVPACWRASRRARLAGTPGSRALGVRGPE